MALSPTSSVKSAIDVNSGLVASTTYTLNPSLTKQDPDPDADPGDLIPVGYDGRGMHHMMYFYNVAGGSITINASFSGGAGTFINVATITADTIVRTGAITDLPYAVIAVTTGGGVTAGLDLHSFGTVVR